MVKRAAELVPLSWDHHHALVLARRIAVEAPDASSAALASLIADVFERWEHGLLPHFRCESECLLARLIRHVPADDPGVLRLQRDHLRMAALIATIRDTAEDERRRAAVLEFGDVLQQHVRWEESDLFERTQAELNPEEMAALGEEIARTTRDLPR